MRLVTEQENQEFHLLLDTCIDKMNNDKNRYKPHWNTVSLTELKLMIMIESHELVLATHRMDLDEMNSELDDIINLAMFMKHNILKGV